MSNSINNPENEEKHLYDPVDYNPHIGLATIDPVSYTHLTLPTT